MTDRCDDSTFAALAALRAQQGFNCIQLVAGIPPECGPENDNVSGNGTAAWNLDGEINQHYLDWAYQRVKQLNQAGLEVILYGAWGYQINWNSPRFMNAWWAALIRTFDDLDIIYCLSGELDLWPERADRLLNNHTTADIDPVTYPHSLIERASDKFNRKIITPYLLRQRIKRWDSILLDVSKKTDRAFLIHTTGNKLASETTRLPHLLCCDSMQSGHSQNTRNTLWQCPVRYHDSNPSSCLINLEPWYEGITDDFGTDDQLYAYWVSVLAGAPGHCYGAHGIWNMGDGSFLSQWGEQTLNQAMQLPTPSLIGKSHAFFLQSANLTSNLSTESNTNSDGSLKSITRSFSRYRLTYICNVEQYKVENPEVIWLAEKGVFIDTYPKTGAVVVRQRLSQKNKAL